MLLVKTYLDKSKIHGLGVFAGEFIPKGGKIWVFAEGFDRAYSPKEFKKLPKAAQDFIRRYGYQINGEIMLTVDHDCYTNHSDKANTVYRDGFMVARRNIAKGEEITNDYRDFDRMFCAGFLRKKPK
ncbi:MAG: SET domain-containing protein [Proteobacteria bacterium]|nr:SET domain-containing protein [Pseudomonadota bacterium]